MENRAEGRSGRAALEGRLAGRYLVKHYAKRENISARVELLPLHLFRRRIGHGAHGGAIGGEVPDFLGEVIWAAVGSRRTGFGNTEIENLGVLALGDKDISGFDVAVNDLCGVRRIERIGGLDADDITVSIGRGRPARRTFRLRPSSSSITMNARPSCPPMS
jgi:hypothetical protein